MHNLNNDWEEKLSSPPHPTREFSHQLSIRIGEEIIMNKKKGALNLKSIFTAGIVIVVACFALLYLPLSDSLFGNPPLHSASPSNNDVQTVILQGSSEHWTAQYIQESRTESDFDNQSKTRVVLKYKGDYPITIGQIRYSIKSEAGEISGTGTLFEDGTLNTGSEGKNIALLSKKTIVQVEIQWNDQSESFELKS